MWARHKIRKTELLREFETNRYVVQVITKMSSTGNVMVASASTTRKKFDWRTDGWRLKAKCVKINVQKILEKVKHVKELNVCFLNKNKDTAMKPLLFCTRGTCNSTQRAGI